MLKNLKHDKNQSLQSKKVIFIRNCFFFNHYRENSKEEMFSHIRFIP